jgi:hypothetical protein
VLIGKAESIAFEDEFYSDDTILFLIILGACKIFFFVSRTGAIFLATSLFDKIMFLGEL